MAENDETKDAGDAPEETETQQPSGQADGHGGEDKPTADGD
jgi:hypothetical protein